MFRKCKCRFGRCLDTFSSKNIGNECFSLTSLSVFILFYQTQKFDPKKIVFSGIGKTFDEIKFAIEKNILLINAESESEIKEIEKIAKNYL